MHAANQPPDQASSSYSPLLLTVELAPLDIDAKLSHRHAQILHREHRPVLAASLSTTAVTRPLDTENATRPNSTLSILSNTGSTARSTACDTRLTGDGEPCRGAKGAHGVVCVCVAGADAAVLVGVGGDIGDELLCGQGQETGQAGVGLRWWGEAGAGHVVVCYGVWDLLKRGEGLVSKLKQRQDTAT